MDKKAEKKCKCDKHHQENCECEEACACQDETCTCEENCTCHKEDLNYQTNLEGKVLEYLQTAQRLQAEFENYRKNAQAQILAAKNDGVAHAVTTLVPVLDSIAGAKKMVSDEKLLEGFLMIENQILSAFKSLGVEKIEAVNMPFDPHLHNALAVQNNPDLDDDIIIDEYQTGYKLNEKIIRYSQVIVNKKEEE